MNVGKLLDIVRQDALYALRTMRKNPGFSATTVLTLALAIGGNTAMFTIIHAVLLKPLPYPQSDRLVRVSGGATPTRFAEMKDSAHSVSEIGAFAGEEDIAISGGGEAEVLKAARVSADFLRILQMQPVRGRGFRPEEDSPGGTPVAMISAELWHRRFAGDPHIIGKTATLASTRYVIIGILPARFQFPLPGLDVWLTAPSEWPIISPKSRAMSPFLTVFGRLKPGVSLEQANAEMRVVRRQYAMAHPTRLDAEAKTSVEVTELKDEVVSDVRSMLWMLLGAVGFVLLIACANVASLLLAQATFRSREMALRSALGAARSRLVAQLLGECVTVSLSGGILGILLAAWSLRAIPSMTSLDLPRAGEVHLDWMVFGFAAVLSVATGVLFGLAPSLSSSRPDLIHVLRTSGDVASHGMPRGILPGLNLRGLLLVAQVALSVVLLIGAALLLESMSRLRDVAIGFNPANLLTTRLSLSPTRYDTDQKKTVFFQELVRRLGSSPGVRGAAAAMFLPMTGYAGTPVQDASKPPLKLNERPIAIVSVITPGYFRTLEIPLSRGRDFTDRDTAPARPVAIIDEALARRFWPAYPRGLNPVGQHLWIGGVNPKPSEIVGIAKDVHQNLEGSAWPETVYVSFAQNPQASAMLAVRTATKPLGFTSAIRQKVRELDKDQPISTGKTMDDLVDEEVGQRRLLMILLGCFASMALLLDLIGIYGIITYSVAQRTREMGVRRALGAQQTDILRLVVGQSFSLSLAGLAIGIAAAIGLTRLMRTVLFHVSATDPLTFVAVVLLFLLVAIAASYVPAHRATKIDPAAALRVE